MSWRETKEDIKWDVYRNMEMYSLSIAIREILKRSSTVGLLICYRICHYLSETDSKNILQRILHVFFYLRFKKLQERCGIELNQHTSIGYGLRLPHKGNIVIHPQAKIGNLCEIMQGVTIGNNILKSRDKVAKIGNEVMICAGAKIIGAVEIGNTVIIGANAVVTKDVENNSIVGGIPAKVIGKCNSDFVINRKEVDEGIYE